MIYVETNIVFKPGKRDSYLEDDKERASLAVKAGTKRIGGWITTVGNVNEFTSINAFEDLAQWQEVQATLTKNAKWQALLKKHQEDLVSVTRKMLTPTPESPLK
jgi:hypothetical protein